MYKAIIKPQDCLILGNGKSFNAGENIFRDTGSLVLNTQIYSTLNKLFKDIKLVAVLFYKNFDDTLIFPFPLDYIYLYSEKNKILKPIIPIKQPEIKFIKDSELKEYFKGEHFKEKFSLRSLKNLKILKNNKEKLKKLKEDIENTFKDLKKLNITYSIFETGIKLDKRNKLPKKVNFT